MKIATLVPAYGRDYKSHKDVMQDWTDNKDFRMEGIYGAGYVNRQQLNDLKNLGFTHLEFRYKRLEQVFIVEVKKA